MSTLKTISIQHPNSSSANIGLGTDGSVTVGTAMTLRPGAINVVGVVTATTFSGNIIGVAATFSGNVSIAGTLTYEDVTNVDSVGLVTARSGANITGGNLLVGTSSSTGTASQPLQVTGGAYVSDSIGIGTINPNFAPSGSGAKLNVWGGQLWSTVRSKTATGDNLILSTTESSNNMQLLIGHSANSYWRLQAVEQGIGYRPLVLQLDGSSVGIGLTNPSTTLQVNGTATVTTLVETSSITLKENINPIVNALDKIVQLNPVTYDRKSGESKNEAGLIAEEVNEIIPNIVSKDDEGNPNGINYTKLSVYLIDAIKELKKEIDDLRGN